MWILKYNIGKFLHDIETVRYFLNKVKKTYCTKTNKQKRKPTAKKTVLL